MFYIDDDGNIDEIIRWFNEDDESDNDDKVGTYSVGKQCIDVSNKRGVGWWYDPTDRCLNWQMA